MSTTIDGVSGGSNIQFSTDNNMKMSVAEMAALLFLQRSEVMNDIASSATRDGQARLAEIKLANDMKARAMELKQDAKDAGGNHTTEMPADMVKYFNDNGIKFDTKGNDNYHKAEEWDVNIENLSNHIQNLSSNNDLAMIQLKSWINKAQEALQAGDNMWNKVSQVTNSVVANLGR